ncbi:MAG: neutral zinc metallopeptidase [Gammaproteobacteria bacterium]|nr:neutral zinc metallopeptidase [Gammaproteobacteria bacterium]NNF61819.1 flagellar biosynthesis protein FlgM [Gammaproteobacteria bacterium]NNM19743.1 flagellar biosynthesis protein FlgM [Gammaproteobacteria bacterium]
MRWKKGRRSQNIDDRRGQQMRRAGGIGGGAVVIALLAAVFLGQNPATILEQLGGLGGTTSQVPDQRQTAASDEAADFVSVVLADTEDVWNKIFEGAGSRYSPPQLVLYSGATRTDACGLGQAAAGPFYCPGDYKVYIDLSFLNELKRLGAPGDFAFAYVIAHEVGHHIQNLVGTATEVRQAQQRSSKRDQNALQVMMELQADCYAGVWAHHAHRDRQVLEEGDVEEGLAAAASVGDDRLQQSAGRRVHPESFTHGSSEQRAQWFYAGLESGSVNACDTFSG